MLTLEPERREIIAVAEMNLRQQVFRSAQAACCFRYSASKRNLPQWAPFHNAFIRSRGLNAFGRVGVTLGSELTQMMIKVFVHQLSPLFRLQSSEETVWMLRACRWPTRNEAVDQSV